MASSTGKKTKSPAAGRTSARTAPKKRLTAVSSNVRGKTDVVSQAVPRLQPSLEKDTTGRDEIIGWVSVILAILLMLGIYLDILGSGGRFVRHYWAVAFGWGEDVLPLTLLFSGITLIMKRPRRGIPGIGLSLIFIWLSASGLAALAAGSPKLNSSSLHLAGAGGYVGSGVALPLESLIGTAGTAVVLAVIFFIAASGSVSAQARTMAKKLGLELAGLSGRIKASFRARYDDTDTADGAQDGEKNIRDVAAFRAEGSASPAYVDGMYQDPIPQTDKTPVKIDNVPIFLGAFDDDNLSEDALSTKPNDLLVDPDPSSGEDPGKKTALAGADVAEGERDGSTFYPAREQESSGHGDGGVSGSSGPGVQLSLLSLSRQPYQWKLPKLRLLKMGDKQAVDRQAIHARGLVLEAALASHGVETHLLGFTSGPTVTRYELELGAGVKVAKVTSLAKDIAYAMASPDVRILAPIPGKSAIGVEVPNHDRHLVTLGEVLASPEAKKSIHPLEVAIGRDIAGRAVMVNLAEMPHLLIAGATGAGKSSCLNSLLTSILMRSTPDQVKLILIDPKRVELGQYNGLPHLLTPVVVNPKKAANALNWAVTEMERRYDLLAEAGVRDITGYNQAVLDGTLFTYDNVAARLDEISERFAPKTEENFSSADEDSTILTDDSDLHPLTESRDSETETKEGQKTALEPLPYVLLVVDELNDLMMVAARDVEDSICRIAQMARAVGIHLVIATQRPSVDVITGVIKANIPSRLAFSVSSLADSRVILDQPGAERLIGRGDLLLLSASSSVPRRIQGPWVSEEEVKQVVKFWLQQSEPKYQEGVQGENASMQDYDAPAFADDDLLDKAIELVVSAQVGSTSMLQRKLRVGFSRAGRLMDLLEQKGIVGPAEGSKARAVLMTKEELEEMHYRAGQ